MALQIANPAVVSQVEALAQATGWTKTGVVSRAVERLARELMNKAAPPPSPRLDALLAQMDAIAGPVDAADPLDWDEQGLPR
jgi:antitoxin VapB